MKKVLSALLAVVMTVGFSVSVAADSEAPSSDKSGDFLLRGNSWGTKLNDVVESGTHRGTTDAWDGGGHEWTSSGFSIELDGEAYVVRYDFTDDDKLFEVAYLGETSSDNSKLDASYKKLVSMVTEKYGTPKKALDDGKYAVTEWNVSTGDIVVMKLSGNNVQAFYTAPGFDWSTLDSKSETSAKQNDFLLRGNSWEAGIDDIKDSGEFDSEYTYSDSGITGKSYSDKIDGIESWIDYRFISDGQMYGVVYNIDDSYNYHKAYDTMKKRITEGYGAPTNESNDVVKLTSIWELESGKITLTFYNGDTEVIYSAPDFNFDTMSFAAGEGISFEETVI